MPYRYNSVYDFFEPRAFPEFGMGGLGAPRRKAAAAKPKKFLNLKQIERREKRINDRIHDQNRGLTKRESKIVENLAARKARILARRAPPPAATDDDDTGTGDGTGTGTGDGTGTGTGTGSGGGTTYATTDDSMLQDPYDSSDVYGDFGAELGPDGEPVTSSSAASKGIGIGTLAVVGIAAYFLLRKKRKGA